MASQMTIKLPAAFEKFDVIILNHTGIDIRANQYKAYWDDAKQKWIVNVVLKPDDRLKLLPGA